MEKKPFVTEEHILTRNVFRALGPLLILAAIGCIVVGFVSTFISPFDNFYVEDEFFTGNFNDDPSVFGGPNKFWLLFIGIPLLAVGGWITQAGYASKVAQYGARELAPVAKETWHYLKEDEQKAVVHTNEAKGNVVQAIQCPSCTTLNTIQAKFCNGCGQAL